MGLYAIYTRLFDFVMSLVGKDEITVHRLVRLVFLPDQFRIELLQPKSLHPCQACMVSLFPVFSGHS